MPKSDYTPEETAAYEAARTLLTRCMQDDVPTEVFQLAAENLTNVAIATATARLARLEKKSIIERIFKK